MTESMSKSADTIFTRTNIFLSFADRFRVLVTGKLRLDIEIACEHLPGATTSRSSVVVPPIIQRKSSGGGCIEEVPHHGAAEGGRCTSPVPAGND